MGILVLAQLAACIWALFPLDDRVGVAGCGAEGSIWQL